MVYLIKYSLNRSGYNLVTNLNVIKLARDPIKVPIAPMFTPCKRLSMYLGGVNVDSNTAAGTLEMN